MWMGLVGYESVFVNTVISGLAVGKGGSAPDLAELRDGLFLNAFDGAGVTTEEAFFTIQVLPDIRPGSAPTFHIHWAHNAAVPSGNVKWQIDTAFANVDSVIPVTESLSVIDAAGDQYTHQVTDEDGLVMSAANAAIIAPQAIQVCRIYRDPTDAEDTFEDDAFLMQIDMNYEKAAFGSRTAEAPFDNF